MRKEFHKDYSRLSTYQRFSLVVKKLAREDKAEVRRLVNSCPTGRDQYTKLLNAARECTLLISLELQVMVGRWESFNTLVLPQLEAAHVDYFNTTFRNSPERVNKVGVIVGTLDDLLHPLVSARYGSLRYRSVVARLPLIMRVGDTPRARDDAGGLCPPGRSRSGRGVPVRAE